MATHLKLLGLTLDSKLTYSTPIHNISAHAHTTLQIIKELRTTGWGKQKEILMVAYKAVLRPALEYASSIWSPLASSTSISILQVMQNAALRTATGCTQDTHIQHLHDETIILPIQEHLYIYYRFIVRFPIGLDILFITFTFLLHLLLSWTSSLSISSSAIPASTLSNHVFLGLPTGLLPSTLYSIHFFTQSSSPFLITCPYHLSLSLLMKVVIGSTPTSFLNSSFVLLSFN